MYILLLTLKTTFPVQQTVLHAAHSDDHLDTLLMWVFCTAIQPHLVAIVYVFVSRGGSSAGELAVVSASTGSPGTSLHRAAVGERQTCAGGGGEENL